ncbi:hypothetical protein ACN6KS_07060 [Paenibacillus nitricinens]
MKPVIGMDVAKGNLLPKHLLSGIILMDATKKFCIPLKGSKS